MTKLTQPVRRKTDSMIRDGSKLRNMIVTIYPNGTIGLRPERTRREEVLTMVSAYGLAVKQRVAKERVRAGVHTRVLRWWRTGGINRDDM